MTGTRGFGVRARAQTIRVEIRAGTLLLFFFLSFLFVVVDGGCGAGRRIAALLCRSGGFCMQGERERELVFDETYSAVDYMKSGV